MATSSATIPRPAVPARRVKVVGVSVDCVDMPGALAAIDELIEAGRPRAVLAVNPEKVMFAHRDPALFAALEAAGLLIPDGIGVVLAARLLRGARLERVTGVDLMLELCAHAAERGYKLYLYGARPESNRQAVAELRRRHPGIRIVGHRDGYTRPEDMPALIEDINASGADILFVGLGSPRQELWIHEHLAALRVPVCQGVGGSLDVVAGRIRRAPRFVRRFYLEWLYRLIRQPARAVRQSVLPQFAFEVLREKLSRS